MERSTQEATPEGMTDQGRRITVVDDHAETRQLLADILGADGHLVTLRAGVDPQLHALRDSMPDLLVVDLLLSTDRAGLSGWDVIRLARSHAELYTVPVLVISADYVSLRRVEQEARAMSDIALLAKPFGLDELRATIRALLDDGERTPAAGAGTGVASARLATEPETTQELQT